MKDILSITSTLLFAYLLTSPLCFSQDRKPSTPEERTRVVQLAHSLEANPLGEESKKARHWLSDWVDRVSDIHVPSCSHFLESTTKSKPKYAKDLILQMRSSLAAFIIEHPDQADDADVRVAAGVTGMIKAYQSILKNDQQARWEFLDVLTNQQNTDEFHRYVREVMARCSEVPLSDKNKRAYGTGDTVYAPIEVSKPAQIKTKPAPLYDDQAKANSIQGTVVLMAVFASSGQVTDIEVLEGLPYGLTESCIVAAHRIRFEPAVKDNHPVPTLMRLEYYFSFDR